MKRFKFKQILYLNCIFLAFALNLNLEAKTTMKTPDVIVIHRPEIPRVAKEALLILPGIGDSKKRRQIQKAYFENQGYDLFIPNYIVKNSYTKSIDKFELFYYNHKLEEYSKVHVFSYVLGSWIINTFIKKNGYQNISTIVYDRSPLQERAPRIVAEVIPNFTKLIKGKVTLDFAKIVYPSIVKMDINIGIIVESKATKLIRFFRKKTTSYGEIDWNNLDFKQEYDDLIYTHLNHDEMYTNFDDIGNDIISFIKTGQFLNDSRRVSFMWDVFEKYKN